MSETWDPSQDHFVSSKLSSITAFEIESNTSMKAGKQFRDDVVQLRRLLGK